MIDVHFGAGNIGRGFIGEVLNDNNFNIVFVDANEDLINSINNKDEYKIEFAQEKLESKIVTNFSGINNMKKPEEVISAIAEANLVTTAIGPNILKFIAPLIAKGISKRFNEDNFKKLDIVACENMIGGSQQLKKYVYKDLDEEIKRIADKVIGFPNAAVDRIVPAQNNKVGELRVTVEPFKEWAIDKSQMKNINVNLKGVHYVDDLEPYIERKLFSVNTGHATVAYNGFLKGYKTIIEAINDEEILNELKKVLEETGNLILAKWNFNPDDLHKYQNIIISRFQNSKISDDISRVARTPIRKLGYNERFIRPIRELKERSLDYHALAETAAKVLKFNDENDEQSVELQNELKNKSVSEVVKKVTDLHDEDLILEIVNNYNK